MIGKIIGAFVGDRIAKQTSGVGGATGAAVGVVAATVLRRMSLPAMLALGAGGYLAKRYFDRQSAQGETSTPPVASTVPRKTKTAKPAKVA
ncbi:hypothetical protein [Qipengyuania qiaonensis]|uniref:DUF456 domain-containing protein n=1 Tax=Qipengyuania qiaonensis TaxID=2867240 RepID=A0ABS7JA50_9SPHN|nr:hypothetical protein [Qipengyuania qiaonensis]MBX7483828.1 hypothetical protein [Qipengyuania qiaonensis]